MNLLDWDTPAEKVLEEFPMLEDMGRSSLVSMKNDCEDTPGDEPFVRAIDILLKHIEDGSYFGPEEDE